MSLPKQLLESKLITDEQWKEYQELKEEVNDLRRILNMQHKREYYSKFFKDFQKEKGKNVYPDFDEIYKRYDKQKEEIERLNKELEEKEAILGGIQQLEAEIERLNNNWNKLKNELENILFFDNDTITYEDLMDIINRVEESDK